MRARACESLVQIAILSAISKLLWEEPQGSVEAQQTSKWIQYLHVVAAFND